MAAHTGSGATHAVVPNPKNESIMIGMRDGVTGKFELRRRHEATVSVFDSNFLIGDGIWVSRRASVSYADGFSLPATTSTDCSSRPKL